MKPKRTKNQDSVNPSDLVILPELKGRDPDELLHATHVCKIIPGRRPGKGLHTATLWRWCLRGFRGIRLRRTKIGGMCFIRVCDLVEFLTKVSRIRERGVATGQKKGESASCPPDPEADAVREELARRHGIGKADGKKRFSSG